MRLFAALALMIFMAAPAAAEIAVHRGNRGEPLTLAPHKTPNGWEVLITMELFTGLTAAGPAGEIIPGAAHDWDVSADGLTYTWHLRDGMTWSDGEPLTAADFVYSFRRLMDPVTASPVASLFYPIAGGRAVNTGARAPESLGVRAVDDLTLEMTLEHPAPYLPQLFVHRGFPVPRHVVETAGERWARPGTFVGNGAFILDEWVPGSHVRMAKNPAFYAADTVALDALYFYPAEDLESAITRFRAGELDTVPFVPRARLDWARENMPESLRIAPSLGVEYLIFNVDKPPYDDIRVRQALAMAITRLVLVKSFLKAGEIDAYSLVHPAVMGELGGYQAPVLLGSGARRLERAKDLLNEAGYDWDKPLRVQLRYNSQDTVAEAMDVVSRMWQRLFIEVELINSDTATLYADVRNGDFEIARAAWYPEVTDPQSFLYLLKSTSGPMNQSGYNNPEFDALLDEADRTADPLERLKVYRRAEEIAGRDQPVTPLFYYSQTKLVSPEMGGWLDHNRNIHPGRYFTKKTAAE